MLSYLNLIVLKMKDDLYSYHNSLELCFHQYKNKQYIAYNHNTYDLFDQVVFGHIH